LLDCIKKEIDNQVKYYYFEIDRFTNQQVAFVIKRMNSFL